MGAGCGRGAAADFERDATVVGRFLGKAAGFVVIADDFLNPRSRIIAMCWSRDLAVRPPNTTPINRRPLRETEAARLNPDALILPVLIPSVPG